MGNSSSSGGQSGGTGGERSGGSGGITSLSGMSSRVLGDRRDRNGGGGGGGGGGGHRVHLPSSLPSPFRSGNGSLGLSRADLDARCQPSGLYPNCEWEPKQIRRLIGDGKLAARLKGADSRTTKTDRECPICFMYYSENNMTKCCQATICTECYLQIKPQKDKHTTCPFCNCSKLVITVQKGMDEDAVARREEEEQVAIEALIRSRAAQVNRDAPGPMAGDATLETGSISDGGGSTASGGFGSSLENYNRTRTFSNGSSHISNNSDRDEMTSPLGTPARQTSTDESSALLSLAMSPEDRDALEREMREQLSHPTHRRMEEEAEEARMRHAQEWSRSDSGIRSRMRDTRMAELTRLLANMSRGDNDDDDEGDEGGRARVPSIALFGLGGGDPRSRELSGLIRALQASPGSQYHSNSMASGNRGRTLDDLMRLEAAFFLGMDDDMRRHVEHAGRQRNSNTNSRMISGRSDTENEDNNDEGRGATGTPSALRFGRSGVSLSSGRAGSSRFARGISNRGVSGTHMDTAELLMRGISEEEQLAMAIALSMQEPQAAESDGTATTEEGGQSNNQNNGNSDNNQGNGEQESSSESSLDDNEEEVVFSAAGQENGSEHLSDNTSENT